MVRHDIASYEALENLFEHVQSFLQRLDHCTIVPFTPEMTELLAKIMAQILSVLAFSTKEIKERRISRSFHSISFLADYGIEKFMKRVGKFMKIQWRTKVSHGLISHQSVVCHACNTGAQNIM